MSITSLSFELRIRYPYQNWLCSLFQALCTIRSELIHIIAPSSIFFIPYFFIFAVNDEFYAQLGLPRKVLEHTLGDQIFYAAPFLSLTYMLIIFSFSLASCITYIGMSWIFNKLVRLRSNFFPQSNTRKSDQTCKHEVLTTLMKFCAISLMMSFLILLAIAIGKSFGTNSAMGIKADIFSQNDKYLQKLVNVNIDGENQSVYFVGCGSSKCLGLQLLSDKESNIKVPKTIKPIVFDVDKYYKLIKEIQ